MNDLYNKFCISCINDLNKDADITCGILIESLDKDIRDIKNDNLVKAGNFIIECKKYKRSGSNV
jgi:hypothetical protein